MGGKRDNRDRRTRAVWAAGPSAPRADHVGATGWPGGVGLRWEVLGGLGCKMDMTVRVL